MRSILHLLKLAIVAGLLLFAAACTEAASTAPDTSAISKDYQSYSKDGLSLLYPKHWSLHYDHTPGLYADRSVAFNISDASIVTISIYKNTSMPVSDIRNDYIRSLQLETSEYVKDFKNSQINIGNYSGEKLSWQDTMIVPFSVEIDILKIINSPSQVFAIFELAEEDIKNEVDNIVPVLNSIKLNP